MYFIQIFEKFTNLSSTGAKNASHLQRTTIEAIRFILRTDPEMETSSEGTTEHEKGKIIPTVRSCEEATQPLDQ